MKVLAIETSCDDTGISILEVKKSGKNDIFKILANNTNSQVKIHREFGGVFPMMAKREHQKNLPIVLDETLKQAKIKMEKIDVIAVTYGPGLEPALWTGIVFAKELSLKYKIPIIKVNHMEGHIFSIFPKKGKTFTINSGEKIFPMLSLLVSGGHTEFILVKDWHKYKKIGQTRDDAAGEAFDKVARMLGLQYPGGPEISKMASEERKKNLIPLPLTKGEAGRGFPEIKNPSSILPLVRGGGIQIQLPRPMIHSKDYDFSFSGLKTAVLYLIRDLKEKNAKVLDNINIKQKIACEFEDAVVETLVYKTIKAIKQYKIKTLIVGGGVSANTHLQEVMKNEIKKLRKSDFLNIKTHFPIKSLTGDNALMIGIAGYYESRNKKFVKNLKSLKAQGNLSL
ncbi:MAG: tRNA (adenosine(37)-N6)-threonylcarbamoyltransferase complex transferase subunit TsaD [Candidatus Nomurabacteria bacterium]|nr:tRNA (adenosine(37)-N6)-threonylcarbamoyltransferase complex transferase subunit TsaD [Candidatus Nomurabacteria bacterium]